MIAATRDMGFLKARSRAALTPDARAIAYLDAKGDTQAMLVFDRWTPASAEVHMASDNPVALYRLIRPAAQWAFVQAGLTSLTGVMRSSNSRGIRFAKRAGFREVWRQSHGWNDAEDMVVLEMRREDCRWAPKEQRS